MYYKAAINILSGYHNAQLIWVVPGSSPPTGQLTTGLPEMPLIPVDNGTVCADDLYDVVDKLAEQLQHA